MILIDRSAYCSRLRKIDPVIKLITALLAMLICLFANSYLVSGIIIAAVGCAVVILGGTRPKLLLKLMILPASFILLSVVTILFQRSGNPIGLLLPIKFFGSYYGFSVAVFDFVGRLVLKAFAAVSCMYFLALTTPMTEIFYAFKRLNVPKLIIELMELIYRFIFVINETAHKIYTAQSSRLGYNRLAASYKSLGILISMLFAQACSRSDRIYNALESRGYTGELKTIEIEYDRKIKYYFCSGVFTVILISIAIAEGLVI